MRLRCLLLLAGLALGACATPISVKRVDSAAAHRALTANVLSTGNPSPFSMQILQRLGLEERYGEDPESVLRELHAASFGDDYEAGRRFLLAELSLHHAQRGGGPSWQLAAAVYSWAFLFPTDRSGPNPFDPRTRVAVDLYNRGITEGLREGDRIELRGAPRALPFGTLELLADPAQFEWGAHRLVRFESVAELEVRGLRNRYRRPGIGAPLAATIEAVDPDGPASLRIPPDLRVPATAVVRFSDLEHGLQNGAITGQLELHVKDRDVSVEIAGSTVPLEYEPSAVLADALAESSIWDFEIAGYRSGSFRSDLNGLWAMHPYREGRIPVVFVHGTASSPARWGEMINELQADPVLGDRLQHWLFLYNTGNPILYSANLLRESLRGAVAELDPDGADPALQQMVVIGHSQGGLLTRLQLVESGDRFWDAASSVPFEDIEIDDATRDLLRRSMFFEPVSSISRAIYIATPHRGSFLASWRISSLASRLVAAPANLARAGIELFDDNETTGFEGLERVPTAVDNMRPGSAFARALAQTRTAPGIRVHSIIGVKGEGAFIGGNDGVVEYESAHLDGVESELVVRSAHSMQAFPATVEEVRRVLLEHLREPDRGGSAR